MFGEVVYAQEVPAQNPAPAPGGRTQGNPLLDMLPMVVLFIAVMYFLMIRPNQKREQERQRMLSALSKGDRVVTSGGVMGTIVGLTEKTVVLRVNDDNTKIEFARSSVAQVTPKEGGDS